MKTVIVSLNSQYIHSSLACWYLLSSAKKRCEKGINVKIIEGTVNEEINDILKRIKREKPDIVAFSCYIWNIKTVFKLIDLLENVKIILGGPEVSYCSDKILKEHINIDYVISGEGEEPFAELLNAIYLAKITRYIKGVSYRDNNDFIISEPYISNNVPESPYVDEYFETLNRRISYIETSRGCPFSCAFCLSGRCGGVRYFPIESAFENIVKLANSGSKIIKFVDRTFNANSKRAREILSFIIKNYGTVIPKDVCFHFEIGGDLLTDDDFKLLKTVPKGLIQFEIGMQSFNAKTLEAINRKTNVEKLKSNIKSLVSLGNIHIHIDLIAGLPFEDYKSFRDSFNTGFELNADMLQLGFLKLLHGAKMRDEDYLYPSQFNEDSPYEVTETQWLDTKDLKQLHYCENALERFVNSGRFSRTNKYIFDYQKRNPFDTLTELGMFTGTDSCSLNEYINRLYNFFKNSCDEMLLRDLLLCDFASGVKSNALPTCLIRKDKNLRKFRQFLESGEKTKRKDGVMRKTFLLYSENCGAYVDYDQKVNGKYVINKINFNIKTSD